MSKVTFSAEKWMWFEILGKRDEENRHRTRDDDGLISALMTWMIEQNIDWRAQTSGGGMLIGRIAIRDAPRVIAWLEAHGATERFEGE